MKMEEISKIIEEFRSADNSLTVLVESGKSARYNTYFSALAEDYGVVYDPVNHSWNDSRGLQLKIRDVTGQPDNSGNPKGRVVVIGFDRVMKWEERSAYERWRNAH